MWWKQYIPKPRMFGPWLQDIFDKFNNKKIEAFLNSDPAEHPFLMENDDGDPVVLYDKEMPIGNVDKIYGVSKVCWKSAYYTWNNGPYPSALHAARAYVRECVHSNRMDLIPKYSRSIWMKIRDTDDIIVEKRKHVHAFQSSYQTPDMYMMRHQMP